ncbi:hypothetical protein OFC49_40485, partial [Escherichia coli]|nr:hypothetical protein [Escherichia coli]
MKNNSHNAKQAPFKTAKPKHDNDVNKAKPKRVKKKAAVKAKLSAEKSDVDFIKIAKSGLHESNAHR